jgi:regulator of sirC expression with transglutaminase-like and TPR domain
MNATGTISLPQALSETQRAALLKLLADEDPAIYRTVRKKIISYGPDTIHWLREYKLSDDAALRRRSQEIINHFGRQTADTSFLGFILQHGEELDIEEGAWLLAQTAFPTMNVAGYRALLDFHAGELKERIDLAREPKEILSRMNAYLFQELGFRGNERNYYDPENSYLNRVLDRRTGNPITLCLIYMLLGKRLRLPLAGIGLPGHFICRFQSSATEIYIDAFNGGSFMTKADCVQYLVQGNYGLKEDCLTPVSPRRMLLRCCGNLHQIYLQLERVEETTRVQRYLVALAR